MPPENRKKPPHENFSGDETVVRSTITIAPGAGKDPTASLVVLTGVSAGQIHSLSSDTIIGRSADADILLDEPGISRRHARVFHQNPDYILEDLGSANGTFCNGKRVTTIKLREGDKIQLGAYFLFKFSRLDRQDEAFQQELLKSATQDSLTKASNKRHLLDRLKAEISYATRHKEAVSLVMFDIDHFKNVNDQYGHLAGDAVLQQLSAVVLAFIRTEDLLGRYGGEEFAVILRGLDGPHAWTFAERLLLHICQTEFVVNSKKIPLTVSIGISTFFQSNFSSIEEMIGVADTFLYKSKHEGRNRVSRADSRCLRHLES